MKVIHVPYKFQCIKEIIFKYPTRLKIIHLRIMKKRLTQKFEKKHSVHIMFFKYLLIKIKKCNEELEWVIFTGNCSTAFLFFFFESHIFFFQDHS